MLLSSLVRFPVELLSILAFFLTPFIAAALFVRYLLYKQKELEKAEAKAQYEAALRELIEWKKEHPNVDCLKQMRGKEVYFAYIWAYNAYRKFDPFFRDARAPIRSNIKRSQ